MTCAGDEPVDTVVDPAWIERAFVQAETGRDHARLHQVEVDILAVLRDRPLRAWCRAQVALLEGIRRKACGERLTEMEAWLTAGSWRRRTPLPT